MSQHKLTNLHFRYTVDSHTWKKDFIRDFDNHLIEYFEKKNMNMDDEFVVIIRKAVFNAWETFFGGKTTFEAFKGCYHKLHAMNGLSRWGYKRNTNKVKKIRLRFNCVSVEIEDKI